MPLGTMSPVPAVGHDGHLGISPSGGLNKSPESGGGGSSLRAQAPPFFMSGTDLQAVVPLAGYFPSQNPYNNYSPYHNSSPATSVSPPGSNQAPAAKKFKGKFEGTKFPEFPVQAASLGGPQAAAEKKEKAAAAEDAKEEEGLPEMTEEEWARRSAKRRQDTEKMKTHRAYQNFLRKVPKVEDRSADDPKTPRWDDRTVSKRRWKVALDGWVAQLREKYDVRKYPISQLLLVRPELDERPEVLSKTLRTLKQ